MSDFWKEQYEQANPIPAKFLLPDGTVVDTLPGGAQIDDSSPSSDSVYSSQKVEEISKNKVDASLREFVMLNFAGVGQSAHSEDYVYNEIYKVLPNEIKALVDDGYTVTIPGYMSDGYSSPSSPGWKPIQKINISDSQVTCTTFDQYNTGYINGTKYFRKGNTTDIISFYTVTFYLNFMVYYKRK